MEPPRSRLGLALLLTLAAGCLRTPGGGCGGPVVGEPCHCPEDSGIGVPSRGRERAPSPEAVEPGGTVVVHAEVEPAHLLPLLRPDAWCERIVTHDVYEALIRQDPFSHDILPELAESYDVSEDGLELTFHLRTDVRWHDGEPFSSDDVLFTFDTVRDPAVLAATARANLEAVESYEAPDAATFRLRLREPSFLLLQSLESLVIIPRHVFGQGDVNSHPALRHPVGTGPFRFVSWRQGREIVLERNESYWGQAAYLDRVVYRFARDRTLALQMLRRGDVDVMPRLAPAQVEEVRGDEELLDDYRLESSFAPGYSFIVYNTRRPRLADPRVRRALTMLIDRQTLLCALEGCLGRVVSSPLPVGHPGVDPSIEPLPFDPPAARRLLDEAGYRRTSRTGIRERDGRPLAFTLLVPTVSESLQRSASVVQQDMVSAGVRMDILAVDWAVFLERAGEHDFDAAALQLTLDWETDYYVLFHSSQAEGGMNYGAFSSREADDVLERLRRELDQGRRVELLRRLHRILHREQPQTFLDARVESSLVERSIEGAVLGVPWFDERTWWIPASRRDEDGRPAR